MKNYDRRERIWNAWSHVLDLPGRLRDGLANGLEFIYYRIR